jgi:hypothetical protein
VENYLRLLLSAVVSYAEPALLSVRKSKASRTPVLRLQRGSFFDELYSVDRQYLFQANAIIPAK